MDLIVRFLAPAKQKQTEQKRTIWFDAPPMVGDTLYVDGRPFGQFKWTIVERVHGSLGLHLVVNVAASRN